MPAQSAEPSENPGRKAHRWFDCTYLCARHRLWPLHQTMVGVPHDATVLDASVPQGLTRPPYRLRHSARRRSCVLRRRAPGTPAIVTCDQASVYGLAILPPPSSDGRARYVSGPRRDARVGRFGFRFAERICFFQPGICAVYLPCLHDARRLRRRHHHRKTSRLNSVRRQF